MYRDFQGVVSFSGFSVRSPAKSPLKRPVFIGFTLLSSTARSSTKGGSRLLLVPMKVPGCLPEVA